MEQSSIDHWQSRIRSREVSFLSPVAEKSAVFLVKYARNDEGTWGPYKQFPLELHASSLCVQALNACDTAQFRYAIENAIIVLTPQIGHSLQESSVQELTDALNLLSVIGTKSPEQEKLIVALSKKLRQAKNGFGWGYPEPSITVTSEALLSLGLNSRDTELEQILRSLESFQSSEDGGWPITPGGESSLISSALLLLVLSRIGGRKRAKSRIACVNYLSKYLSDQGWLSFKEPSRDLYKASILLRAIASAREFPYDLVLKGVEFLSDEVNQDGGWGEKKDGISSVELTSLCLSALCAAGENKFASSKLAIAALEVASQSVAQLNKEKNQLAADIESQVKREIGHIIGERERLGKRVQLLEGEKQSLDENLTAAQEQLVSMQARLFRLESLEDIFQYSVQRGYSSGIYVDWFAFILESLTSGGLYVGAGISLVFFVSRFFLVERIPWITVPFFVMGIASILAALLWSSYQAARRLLERQRYFFVPQRRLFEQEMELTMVGWPPSKREDFLFRLMRDQSLLEGSDKDVAAYIDHMASRYSEDLEGKESLTRLINLFMLLPTTARYEMADRLRVQQKYFRS